MLVGSTFMCSYSQTHIEFHSYCILKTELFVINLCKCTTKISYMCPRVCFLLQVTSPLTKPETKRKKIVCLQVFMCARTYLMNNSNCPVLSIKCVCPLPIRALIFNAFVWVCLYTLMMRAGWVMCLHFEMWCDARAVYFRAEKFNGIDCLH